MKSKEQIEWELNAPDGQKGNPALDYVDEDPSLPRVLLIGDSISIGYTLGVRKRLQGKANLIRPYQNCIGTVFSLRKIGEWLGKRNWDLIHFNWGLHDLKFLKDEKLDLSGERDTTLEQYEKNLSELIDILERRSKKLIFATTTPVPEGANGRIKDDEIKYNNVAVKIMNEKGVPVNDLYASVLPDLEKYQNKADVHFNEEGYDFLAGVVSERILENL